MDDIRQLNIRLGRLEHIVSDLVDALERKGTDTDVSGYPSTAEVLRRINSELASTVIARRYPNQGWSE
jgi:hypothetical protein